jgi:hypothetical protein
VRKRDLLVDIDYVTVGDPTTPYRLVRLKDPDNPWHVVTRVGDRYVSIHPNRIKARWDDPVQVATRKRERTRLAKHAQAIDLAERLGFTVARDGDGWDAHRDAEAKLTLAGYIYRPGRDALAMGVLIDLDAWLRVASGLAGLLGPDDASYEGSAGTWRAG